MNIFSLGIYLINEIFSFLEYKRRLQICSRSNKLLKILSIKKSSFKLYNYLISFSKKYNITSFNLQNIYNKIFEYFDKELGTEEINLIFSSFKQNLPFNLIKNEMVKLSPLFNKYNEFLGIECSDFILKLVSLYEINKDNSLKNKKITALDISFTFSSSMEKDISFLQENLNYLLSLNQYKNIQIKIIGEGFFTKYSFDYINLEKLEKLHLSYMDLSSNDIIYFFNKVYNSNKEYPLISLNLSLNQLDDECVDLLCLVIEMNFPKLQEINMHGNNFTSIGAEKILQKFNTMKEIDFTLNKLGKREIDLFNKYNKSAKEIKIISNFRFNIRNDFKDNALEDLCIKFSNLKIIEFEENSLGVNQLMEMEKYIPKEDEEVIQQQIKNISSCLNKMKKLEKIYFYGSYKAGQILEKCDDSFLEQIKNYYSSNCKISNKCIEITKRMKNLESFSFFRVPLTDELMLSLNNLMNNNLKNLRELSLYQTFLNSKTIKGLINMIKNMKHLFRFSISENDIGSYSVIQFVKNISENCHELTILDISKTIEPHTEGLDELWDSLSNIYNLNILECQDNYINSKDILLFKNKLSNNFIMLNKLDLSYNNDISVNVLNDFLPEFKKYLNHAEALFFWGVGTLNDEELSKFREIFPGRIRLRNKRK